MEEELVKEVVKKKLIEEKGLSEAEAEKYAKMITQKKEKKSEYIDETMGVLARGAEIMQSMPPEVRKAVAPVLTQSAMSLSTSSSTFDEDMKKMMIELKMVEQIFGNKKKSEESELKKDIEELKKQLLEKKEREKEEKYMKELNDLKKQLTELKQALTQPPEEESEGSNDPIEGLVNLLDVADTTKKRLRNLLGVEENVKNKVDMDEIIKKLREQGYDIKGPPTREELERMKEEYRREMERIREEERRKIEAQVERETAKERVQATKEIVNNIITQVVSIFKPQATATQTSSSTSQTPTSQVSNVEKMREIAKKAKELRTKVKGE